MSKNLKTRVETDSLGEIKVPKDALWGAQTQRAIENFPISGIKFKFPFGRSFLKALGVIKYSAAIANNDLGILSNKKSDAIKSAAKKVINGDVDDHFPIDIFQTGSGTSTNMNANEVIANLASAKLKDQITHLMDAMPLEFSQELSAWSAQLRGCKNSLNSSFKRLSELPQGGTAIGTGINSHKDFPKVFCQEVKKTIGISVKPASNFYQHLAAQDVAAEASSALKNLALALMKISNDLRWMNSGPLTGLSDIELEALQPGSSIMPGKVNPVIPEAVAMASADVIGNDLTISIAAQSGNFQLNVMLPVIAYNLLKSINLLGNAMPLLAKKCIKTFKVNEKNVSENLNRNPILVTALNRAIGYKKAAEIAKKAYKEKRSIIDVAEEMTTIERSELETLLDPKNLTKPYF